MPSSPRSTCRVPKFSLLLKDRLSFKARALHVKECSIVWRSRKAVWEKIGDVVSFLILPLAWRRHVLENSVSALNITEGLLHKQHG